MNAPRPAPTPKAIERALDEHEQADMEALPGRRNHLRSGVLLPICWKQSDDPRIMATLRPSHLREHAGEVCFPGGRPESSDPDLEATALREAREELGIQDAKVLGSLSSIPLYTSDYRLFPYVAQVASGDLTVNTDEVAKLFHISLREVLAQETIAALEWNVQKQGSLSPVFRVEGHLMYGATAHVFLELLSVVAPLFGMAMPQMATCEITWADVLPPGYEL